MTPPQNKDYQYTFGKMMVVMGVAGLMVFLFSPCVFTMGDGTARFLLCLWMFKEFYKLFKWIGARKVGDGE